MTHFLSRTLLGVFMLAAFAGLAATAGEEEPRDASPPAPNPQLSAELKTVTGKILYETYVNDNWEIFICEPDGSNPVNLTHTPDRHELYPQASADGRRICFLADTFDNGETIRSVWAMNRDGSEQKRIAVNARQPCWSPDGKTIAFVKNKYPKFNVLDYVSKGLFFYDLETGKERRHPNSAIEHLYNPTWPANSRWIISTVHGGMGMSHGILAIEVDGMDVVDLKIGGCRPTASPDGKRLCWSRTDNVITIGDIDWSGPQPRIIHQKDLVTDKQHVYHPDWSPDGKYLSFSRGPGGKFKANGPGTHKGLGEFVGVRAPWDLCVVRVEGDGAYVGITPHGATCKEPEWIAPVHPEGQHE